MRDFYFYSEKKIHHTIKEMFVNFNIHFVSIENLKTDIYMNQNILLFISNEKLYTLKNSFFFDNNVVVFNSSKNNYNNNFFLGVKFFNKHININKFIDEVTTSFVIKSIVYEDIKLQGEKIINKKADKETFLTTLEKNILELLIEKKQIQKNFILEDILKIKKDTETKTIESHLTRIRNKLSKINSKLKILSRDNKVFLEF